MSPAPSAEGGGSSHTRYQPKEERSAWFLFPTVPDWKKIRVYCKAQSFRPQQKAQSRSQTPRGAAEPPTAPEVHRVRRQGGLSSDAGSRTIRLDTFSVFIWSFFALRLCPGSKTT